MSLVNGSEGAQIYPPAGNVELPFGIVVSHTGDGGTAISSNLVSCFSGSEGEADDYSEGAADALESFILSLAGAGADIESEAFKAALCTAIEAIGNNMPEDGE